ncbi:acyl-CoA dehydrogenase family protein [Roseovarius aquimarinus]|uniref:Acyl-CoA dehydrogenase family protein n=1 Tax=Roseovarius aquimarinus TaxID=1229156 RepID=A0ABW7I8V9_9RHOB
MLDTRQTTSGPHPETDTHAVENQPGARGDLDLWAEDPALRAHGLTADGDHLALYGRKIGRAAMRDAAAEADRQPPRPRLFDAGGRRLDELSYHPGYHDVMQAALGSGIAALPWEGAVGGHSTHAAMIYMTAQIAPGQCGALMSTYAAIPALRAAPPLFDLWVPKLTARLHDPALRPVGVKAAATVSLALTEKQGGAPVTRAQRDGEHYRLRGHKWACTAPMSDGLIVLAQAPGGPTAFLVPRWLEGTRNMVHIQRLKDMMGQRASGVAEIELADAIAYPLGAEGDGAASLAPIMQHLRLGAGIAPVGLMRAALATAWHWCGERRSGGARLVELPLMRGVLADLALEWEGALALAMAAASAFDEPTEQGRAFARIGSALALHQSARLCPGVVQEAMDCLGVIGPTEESGMPLLLREAAATSLWEGTGNTLCLEILRILREAPVTGQVLGDILGSVTGGSRAYDAALRAHMARFPRLPEEAQARWYVESLASLLTSAILIAQGPSAIADAYVATRLGDARGRSYGAIEGVDIDAILARIG